MTTECHHPPFTIAFDRQLSGVERERIASQIEQLREVISQPMMFDGHSAFLHVVECSWCRKPDNLLSEIKCELMRRPWWKFWGRA